LAKRVDAPMTRSAENGALRDLVDEGFQRVVVHLPDVLRLRCWVEMVVVELAYSRAADGATLCLLEDFEVAGEAADSFREVAARLLR